MSIFHAPCFKIFHAQRAQAAQQLHHHPMQPSQCPSQHPVAGSHNTTVFLSRTTEIISCVVYGTTATSAGGGVHMVANKLTMGISMVLWGCCKSYEEVLRCQASSLCSKQGKCGLYLNEVCTISYETIFPWMSGAISV